ncbi:MAG: TIGR02281 family clan AA aspartic protease [Oceanospirillaceae bacterium]|nr:TIGR02281 family clan AA aspartic protease [Oceanospirillaceae bacterium]
MPRIINILLLVLASSLSAAACAVQVKAVGLMADRAILEIDGQSKMLRAGETGPGGVKLISADSKSAVIMLDGKKRTLKLGSSLAAGYQPPQTQKVTLLRDQSGHYFASVGVNGQTPMQMVVDTGATTLALSGRDAARLGISYINNKTHRTGTASGVSLAYDVVLDSVRIGEIELHNVQASVLDGDFPTIPLLGMSFLRQLRMHEEAGALVLEK